jgi:hypothetical protein
VTAAATVRPRFVEPTRAETPLPVYVLRYLSGIALLVVSTWLVVTSLWESVVRLELTARAVPPLLVGYVLFAGAWFVLPGRPGRGALAALIATTSLWIYLNSVSIFGVGLAGGVFGTVPGPFRDAGWVFKSLAVAGVVAAWFLVRRRPPLTYTVLPVPFAAYAILLFATGTYARVGPFEQNPLSLSIARLEIPELLWAPTSFLSQLDRSWTSTLGVVFAMGAVVMASSWLGRLLTPLMRGSAPEVKAARLAAQQAAWQAHVSAQAQAAAQADAAWRVAEIKRWEDAYAQAHDGERPPPGWSPPSSPAR